MSSMLYFLVDLEHLEEGIVGLRSSDQAERGFIDKALSHLSPEDARKAKRKFRKLARKKIKPEQWKEMTRRQKRSHVLSRLWGRALIRYYTMLPDHDME